MNRWKRLRIVMNATARGVLVLLCLVSGAANAASASNWPMESFDPDLQNLPSMQNGFKLYANYCMGCHSLRFQRYERTADDLGIPHEIALETLVFTGQKIGGLMEIGMDREQAKNWFGAPPPDLTMVTRVRGPEWVYNYLKTFYLDSSRPFGVNNKVFPNVGMPHALLELQGAQREGCGPASGDDARDPTNPSNANECNKLVLDEGSGLLSADAYDAAVYDITNFLYYVGEPTRLQRHRIGIGVLLFLVILGVFTHLLNREYWKDIR